MIAGNYQDSFLIYNFEHQLAKEIFRAAFSGLFLTKIKDI